MCVMAARVVDIETGQHIDVGDYFGGMIPRTKDQVKLCLMLTSVFIETFFIRYI